MQSVARAAVAGRGVAWSECAALGGSGSLSGDGERGYGNGGVGKVRGGVRAICSVGTVRFHGVRAQASLTTEAAGRSSLSSEQKVFEVVAKQAAMVDEQQRRSGISLQDMRPDSTAGGAAELLDDAYVRCGEVCAEYAKTFYLGRLTRRASFCSLTYFQPRKFSRAHARASSRHGHFGSCTVEAVLLW